MKSNARWIVALAVITGACLNEAVRSTAATSKEVAEATEMMSGADAQERAAAAARERDPAWKPSCAEVGLIQIGDRKRPGALKNFCLNGEDDILACFASGIRVYSPNGELLKTLPLDIKPSAICVAKDGSIFVAGDGRVLKLEATGKVLASATSPVANEAVSIPSEMDEMIRESARRSRRSLQEEKERMK